jgi:hypothetical protein
MHGEVTQVHLVLAGTSRGFSAADARNVVEAASRPGFIGL